MFPVYPIYNEGYSWSTNSKHGGKLCMAIFSGFVQ